MTKHSYARTRTLTLLAILLLAAASAMAQSGNTVTIRFAGVPSGSCSPVTYAVNNATGDFYDCKNGAWNAVSGGGGISGLTTNVIPKATSATTIGDSSVTDNGTTISTAETIASGGIGLAGATHTFALSNTTDVANSAGVVTVNSAGALLAPVAAGTSGNVLTSNGTIWTSAAAAGGGITNGAGNNIITKSNGTNLIASSIADNGTTVSLATADLTVTGGNINANGGLLQSSTAFLIRATGGSGLTLNTTGGAGKFLLNPGGHIEQRYDSVQTLPTVHSGTCGTSPSITLGSDDNAMEIVVGTGGVASSCQVDFGQAFAKTDIVHAICTANSETDLLALKITYSTGASITVAATSPFTASGKISVNCW